MTFDEIMIGYRRCLFFLLVNFEVVFFLLMMIVFMVFDVYWQNRKVVFVFSLCIRRRHL